VPSSFASIRSRSFSIERLASEFAQRYAQLCGDVVAAGATGQKG